MLKHIPYSTVVAENELICELFFHQAPTSLFCLPNLGLVLTLLQSTSLTL